MKKNIGLIITIIGLTITVIANIALVINQCYNNNTDKTFIVKNNDTRDYAFEHYCDSIYEVNPDYYLDVLVETDEFQNYIDKHGEWWTN